jgi:hypothetical protein
VKIRVKNATLVHMGQCPVKRGVKRLENIWISACIRRRPAHRQAAYGNAQTENTASADICGKNEQ